MKFVKSLNFAIFFLLPLFVLSQQIKAPIKKTEPEPKKTVTTPKPVISNKLTLKVSPNLRCALKIDGEVKGIIEANSVLKVGLQKGTYLIQAVSTENEVDNYIEEYVVDEVNIEKLYRIDLVKIRDIRIEYEQNLIDEKNNADIKTKEEADRKAKEKSDIDRKAKALKDAQGTFTDARDSRVYKTIKIGNQVWMAENLNYLPVVTLNKNNSIDMLMGTVEEAINTIAGSFCYENNNSNCDKYGRLYDWATAKTACPSGWHLPSDAEWTSLSAFIGSEAGVNLKSVSGWINNNGTDTYGFKAIPAGFRNSYDKFTNIDKYAYWWTSTESKTNTAWGRYINYEDTGLNSYEYGKVLSYSVRCVKN